MKIVIKNTIFFIGKKSKVSLILYTFFLFITFMMMCVF